MESKFEITTSLLKLPSVQFVVCGLSCAVCVCSCCLSVPKKGLSSVCIHQRRKHGMRKKCKYFSTEI